MPYSKYMDLPHWERLMYNVYLDIKGEKQQKWQDEMEIKYPRKGEK